MKDSKADPFAEHKAAHALLKSKLVDYQEKLAPELEAIQSSKALVTVQAEEESDLEKLDALSIRIRSLEIREKSISHKSHESEKWLQTSLVDHIERLGRLTDYLNQKLAREALSQLLAHFPGPGDVQPTLAELAPKTRFYLENTIRPPTASWGWQQPLEGTSQKSVPAGVVIADPIWAPPKREDVVKNLLEAAQAVLASEQLVFERLKGDEHIPPFEKPSPPNESFPQVERLKPVQGFEQKLEAIQA